MRYLLLVIVLILTVSNLAGWALDIMAFKRLGGGSVSMNPVTAICFVLLSLEMLRKCMHIQNRALGALGKLALIAVMSCACIKLFDLIFHTVSGIDSTIFAAELNMEFPKPNKMAPNTALNFVLLAISAQMLYFRCKYTILISQVFALMPAFIASLAIIGYMFDIHSFYAVNVFIPMARNTAISFIALSINILMQNSHKGFMRFLVNKGPAGKMAKFLLPASIFIPLGVGWLRLIGQRENLYDAEFGVALSVTLNIVMLVILTCITARLLFITDFKRRKLVARMHAIASHDSLTGLVNRRVFMENLTRRINLLQRECERTFAVFYLDIDGLKRVNDKLGHEAGDQLLIHTANALRSAIRASDTVARLGGDEFTILYERIDDESNVNALADRILQAMPNTWGDGRDEVTVGISIGMMVANILHETPEEILRAADSALNKAKNEGRNCYRLFSN